MAGGNSTWERSRGEGRHTCRPKSKKRKSGQYILINFFFPFVFSGYFYVGMLYSRHEKVTKKEGESEKMEERLAITSKWVCLILLVD